MNDIEKGLSLRSGRDLGKPDAPYAFGFLLDPQAESGRSEDSSPAPAGATPLVASAADDPYCADELEALVMDVRGFYELMNDPEIQDWAGTEEGLRELTETIGDVLDSINVFVANCGHLLDDEERALVEQLRGAMDEAVRGLNRFEGGEPGGLLETLRSVGEDAADLLRTVGGAAARAAGSAAAGAILFILDRLPKPQPL